MTTVGLPGAENFPAHRPPPLPDGFKYVRSVKIQRPLEEVYAFYRELENLPRFMMHLREVRQLDARRSHWVASGPNETTVEWDAEIVADTPNELLAWRSLPGSEIENRGRVEFFPATGERGTVVRVALDYSVPGGKLGEVVAKLAGKSPPQEIADDLRRLRAVLEAGESPEVLHQVRGERSLLGKIISPKT